MPWEGPTRNDRDRLRAVERRLDDLESDRVKAAILAERERCAKDVWDHRDLDGSTGDDYDEGYMAAIHDAIAAIRKGEA